MTGMALGHSLSLRLLHQTLKVDQKDELDSLEDMERKNIQVCNPHSQLVKCLDRAQGSNNLPSSIEPLICLQISAVYRRKFTLKVRPDLWTSAVSTFGAKGRFAGWTVCHTIITHIELLNTPC